jgi:hypothetical protein
MTKRDLRRQPSKPATLSRPVGRDPEIVVDHHDLLAPKPKLDRALHQRVLTRRRLRVALKLPLRRLPRVHERPAAQM